jgi:chorismate synthase
MTRLRLLTAGESHGRELTAVLDGCPAGLSVSAACIDEELGRRQGGYGRGARQTIESDRVEIVGGVRYRRTTGAPIALTITNRDAGNWGDVLAVEAPSDASSLAEPVRVPRPGHADLGGALLYDLEDIRDVIERASARETAARVACGAVAKLLLEAIGCRVVSHVVAVGEEQAAATPLRLDDVARLEADPLRCADEAASVRMRAAIDAAREAGDTLGGVVEVLAFGYPPGVGTYAQGDRRLEAALAAAVFAVPAIKGV